MASRDSLFFLEFFELIAACQSPPVSLNLKPFRPFHRRRTRFSDKPGLGSATKALLNCFPPIHNAPLLIAYQQAEREPVSGIDERIDLNCAVTKL
jgi:hypothetical protein